MSSDDFDFVVPVPEILENIIETEKPKENNDLQDEMSKLRSELDIDDLECVEAEDVYDQMSEIGSEPDINDHECAEAEVGDPQTYYGIQQAQLAETGKFFDLTDISSCDEIMELFRSVQRMDIAPSESIADIGYPDIEGLSTENDMYFFQIKKLAYDEEYPRREALENVLNTLDNEAFNLVYSLTGNKSGVRLHIGVVRNHKKNKRRELKAVNYGEMIQNAFEGNFNGSAIERLYDDDLEEIFIRQPREYKHAGIISGIPSINEDESSQDYDFQGIDRLINSMLGKNWRIVVVCEPVDKNETLETIDRIYELYNRLSVYAKMSVQSSVNSGESSSVGRNESSSTGRNRSWSVSDTDSKGNANSSGTRNSGTSHQKSFSEGSNSDHSRGSNSSYSHNSGSSQAVTLEMANRHAQDLMQYIDDELLPRMKVGYGKGLFKVSLIYMAEKLPTAHRLKLSIMSLFQGNKSNFSPLTAHEIDLKKKTGLMTLNSYQNRFYAKKEYSLDAAILLSKPIDEVFGAGISSYLTAREASILAGLPQKEVPGIVLNESVEFGLNEQPVNIEDQIEIGDLVQKERRLDIRFSLKKDSMMKHTFIAGVTGSGKTTTCHKLLSASNTNFLVIEPAKTEYRTLVQKKNKAIFGEVHVFTLGNESMAPFRINPFELVEKEVISAHIDMVKATFTSAFPMEASMPQILEEAIIKCYENKGWSLDTNSNSIYGEPFGRDREKCFPIMSELLEQMKMIVKEKGFSPQMQADYEGSLVSRLSNLTVGAKGRMLDCPYSTDFDFIVDNNVILEMEELKSPEDKALLMGFIFSRLTAVIRARHKTDHTFRHLTLVEEAHRLLSKVEIGDSGSKKSAVETFTDLLAEIRKYGEGLIVVDQIPNKLAPEVLKNTNTKIIHKILARDDKEAVGDTMLMDDKQKEYLSALETGHAIIFSEYTDKPVHVFVDMLTNTNEEEIDEEYIRKNFRENLIKYGEIYSDLDIVHNYALFEAVSAQISRRNANTEEFEKFKSVVLEIADSAAFFKKKTPVRDVLVKFYMLRERMRANEIKEEYLNRAVDFLYELINDGAIELEDMDYQKCLMFS